MQWAIWFSGGGTAVFLGVLNYLVGPWAKARKRRDRFFDLAFGHDGSDGLPENKDIFTRLGNVEALLNRAALLNGKGDKLVTDVAWLRRTLAAHLTDDGAHQ